MPQAKNGDTVKVHYTGRLDDGTVFDSSVDREPMEFTLGNREIMPGFEKALIGMSPGESKEDVLVPADEAYGPHIEEIVAVMERKNLPEDFQPEIGQRLRINQEEGGDIVVFVTDVTETTVTMDGNHPLSGKDLNFDIELIEIV